MGSATDRFILLGAAHGVVVPDLKRITDGSVFLYEREHELQNVLLESYAEMAYVVNCYRSAFAQLLSNGTPELPDYVKQLNESTFTIDPNATIELHAFDLSTYFKTFLLLTKGALDKLVPLYSYRFYESAKQFSDKGTRLIKAIKNNKRVSRATELVALIEENKRSWIDSLIDLRDEYAHYSNLPAYENFTLTGERANKKEITGIKDFNPPSVRLDGRSIVAMDYMNDVQERLISFFNQFLLYCEFTPGRRPKHYLECECGHHFAKRQKTGPKAGRLVLQSEPLELRVKDRSLDYAVIICPKCKRTTDTDLKFWVDEGLNVPLRGQA
jgi:hypothetical protein